jgi:hypothetical protein
MVPLMASLDALGPPIIAPSQQEAAKRK